ncbi:hypothetical protein HYY71_07405, partial [Candidatus Woesearchaeota archaeon]|nr:hypothetical protein [Candidatus Woesearchaeota archaeon]
SFKAKFDYNLQEWYNTIRNNLDEIVDDCIKNNPDMEKCLEDKSKSNNWNCVELKDEATEILYEFIGKFNDCLNLEEDGVVCRFSLDEREITSPIKSFDIILTNQNLKTRVEVRQGTKSAEDFINLENLVYTAYDNRDTLSERLNPVNIILEYQGKKPIIKDIFGKDDSTNRIPLSKNFLLYKKDKQVKFVEAPGSSFEAPVPANKVIDLPRTKGFKFCAKSGKEVYALDGSDNKLQEREIIFKFAVTFPNPPVPPSVNVLAAEDKLKAEKSIVLRWNKVKNDDGTDFKEIDYYNVYCSKNSFLDKNKQISLENVKPTMAVKSEKNYDSWIADLSVCGKEPIEENVDYYFAVTAVSKSRKESSVVVQSSAKSIDDLAPGTQDIVLINSDGKKERKTSTACIDLPAEKEGKPGNIWVGFFAPVKNEDDTTNAAGISEYYIHFSKQAPVTTNLDECVRHKCIDKLTFVPKDEPKGLQPEIDLRQFNRFREIEKPENFFQEGQTYCFTIVAKDKNNNIIKTLPHAFARPPQWLDMDLKPVNKGFWNDKNELIYS